MIEPNLPRPIVYVASRIRAHELFLLAASVLIGTTFLITGIPVGTALAVLRPPWQQIWCGVFAGSGLLALAGSVTSHHHVEFGLRLEQSGLLINTGPLLVWCTVVLTFAGWRAFSAGVIYIGWAAAHLYRVWQIQR